MNNKHQVRILVTGGGTGGHVSPALAVIQTLREKARDADWQPVFRYIGSDHGVEKQLAQDAGVEFVGVQTGKLRRARTVRGLLTRQNFTDALRVPLGIVQSLREVSRFKPDVVLATGGYVSIPPTVAAWLLRRPILIHEQTVQIGLANRIAARCASKIALTFAEAQEDLPKSLQHKVVITGNPVRQVIYEGDRMRAIDRFGFSEADHALPTVYVTGGAQGAKSINTALQEILRDLLDECRIIHQCGRQPEGQTQDLDLLLALRKTLSQEQQARYFVIGFVGPEIGDVFALTDLVVGRSGAGTVAEVCALGKPSLFIPLVPTGGDEQNRNARRLAEIGAAEVLPSSQLTGTLLLSTIQGLLRDPERRRGMSEAAYTLAKPHAAEDLSTLVLQLANVSD